IHPAEGSLQDLLDAAEKKAFYDNEITHINVRSHIRGAFAQEKSSDPAQLLAILDNSSMVKYFKAENSTYARMTAYLPKKMNLTNVSPRFNMEYFVVRESKSWLRKCIIAVWPEEAWSQNGRSTSL
ncbi:TPA: hypothetical protein N2Q99_002964, partial [Citrobacter freundii]|nr:hypothetical protein [Citrobacter freundii]